MCEEGTLKDKLEKLNEKSLDPKQRIFFTDKEEGDDTDPPCDLEDKITYEKGSTERQDIDNSFFDYAHNEELFSCNMEEQLSTHLLDVEEEPDNLNLMYWTNEKMHPGLNKMTNIPVLKTLGSKIRKINKQITFMRAKPKISSTINKNKLNKLSNYSNQLSGHCHKRKKGQLLFLFSLLLGALVTFKLNMAHSPSYEEILGELEMATQSPSSEPLLNLSALHIDDLLGSPTPPQIGKPLI